MSGWKFLSFLICTLSASISFGQSSDDALRKVFDDYHEQFLILFPLEATAFGDSRYNDQLQIDISPDFAAKKAQFYTQTLDRLHDRPQSCERFSAAIG